MVGAGRSVNTAVFYVYTAVPMCTYLTYMYTSLARKEACLTWDDKSPTHRLSHKSGHPLRVP